MEYEDPEHGGDEENMQAILTAVVPWLPPADASSGIHWGQSLLQLSTAYAHVAAPYCSLDEVCAFEAIL